MPASDVSLANYPRTAGYLRMPPRGTGRAWRCLLLAFLVLLFGPRCGRSQSCEVTAGPVAPDEIVRRMVEQNQVRSNELRYFTSRRHYHVDFHGLGRSMSADMHAQVTYNAASGKTFQVIDESGSHILLNHVLMKLLETERDDSRQHEAGLIPLNYIFKFEGSTTENGRQLYAFTVEPKTKHKLLYSGRIWVDAEDYAVVKVEAEPAASPSFWIKSTHIHHVYGKNGEFWLPKENRSESKIRMGGTALLTIDYGSYQFETPSDPNQTQSSVGTSR